MKHVGTYAGARAVRQKMRLNPYQTSILNNSSCLCNTVLVLTTGLQIHSCQILTSKIIQILGTEYFEQITIPRLVGTLCLKADLF